MVRQQAQVFAVTTIVLLVALGLMGWWVLAADEPLSAPPLGLVAAQVVAGAAAHLLCDAVGYRATALVPGTPAAQATHTAVATYQARTTVRTVLCEAVGVVSFAAAFVIGGGGAWPGYLTGALVSVVLLLVHTWPGTRPVDRTRRSLERDGVPSGLREAYGLPPAEAGAVQRL